VAALIRGLAATGLALMLAACSGGGATTPPATTVPATSTAEATQSPVTAAPATEVPATEPPAQPTEPTAGAPCAPSTVATTVAVSVAGFAWVPETVTAKVGDVITWTNGDTAPHKVGLDDGSCQSERIGGGGGSASLVFSAAGTFPFHCTIHPSMKGTFVIE